MRFLFLALLSAATFAAGVDPALACSCFTIGPACQAYWKTDAVFDAVVAGIDALPRDPDNPFLSDILVKLDVRHSPHRRPAASLAWPVHLIENFNPVLLAPFPQSARRDELSRGQALVRREPHGLREQRLVRER